MSLKLALIVLAVIVGVAALWGFWVFKVGPWLDEREWRRDNVLRNKRYRPRGK